MMSNLISFEIGSDFGFFKKPDVNQTSLTYNLPPKPAILGIIGSILGMDGTGKQDKSFPEYYTKLEHLKIGIMPIGEFPFNKIINTYNSINSYFYTTDNSPNKIVQEQILIKPKYRIYVYDKNQNHLISELVKRLENNNPVFMSYLGKNEFIASFANIHTINNSKRAENTENISSVFLKNKKDENDSNVGDKQTKNTLHGSYTVSGLPTGFRFIENYPISYSEEMH